MLTAVITNYKLNFNLLETFHGYTQNDKQKNELYQFGKIWKHNLHCYCLDTNMRFKRFHKHKNV